MRAGSSLPDHYACIRGGRGGGGGGEDDAVFDGKFATTCYQRKWRHGNVLCSRGNTIETLLP